MHSQPVFRLNRQALIAVIISAAFPIVSHAAAGRVEFAIGNVTASGADGRERPLTKGGEINNGDTIQTADGRTQIKFTDGGYMSLQPNTQFKVDDYAYEGKADGSEKGFFKLVKGSLRAITGAIGHTNKTTYRINTPVATIGIRGTELTGEYTEEGDKKQLKVHVIHGSVYLENEFGDLILFQGQDGIVTDEGDAPEYGDEEPLVTAAGPDDGKPQEDDEQQQNDLEQSDIFTAGEQYGDDGVPEALGDQTDPLLDALASYAAANAVGFYDLDVTGAITGIANTGSDPGDLYATAKLLPGSTLTAYFGSYTIFADLSVLADTCGDGCDEHAYFSASGSIILANASFGLNGSNAGFDSTAGGPGTSNLCVSGCSFNAVGLFSGPTAQNAGINYTINGTSTDSGTITGTAGFHAPIVPALPPG